MSEIKPNFAPVIQSIWDDCGTHVEGGANTEEAAKEIEFFVNELVKTLAITALKNLGYINE